MAKKIEIVPHTLTTEINFYAFPVDPAQLDKAGLKAELGGSEGRLVFGAYFDGAAPHDVCFVERRQGDAWATCSDEVEGERVEKILSGLKVGDAVEMLLEIRDGFEEWAEDEALDDGGDDDDDDDGWVIQSFEEDEKLFVLNKTTDADAAKVAQLASGTGETRIIIGRTPSSDVLFVERKNKWWRRASDEVRGEDVHKALASIGRTDGITFLKELAEEDAADAE